MTIEPQTGCLLQSLMTIGVALGLIALVGGLVSETEEAMYAGVGLLLTAFGLAIAMKVTA